MFPNFHAGVFSCQETPHVEECLLGLGYSADIIPLVSSIAGDPAP
jgi:hypothetical protein